MMKRAFSRKAVVKTAGLLAILLAIGLVMAGCEDPNSKKDDPPAPSFPAAKGKLTINDIPSTHNGKYVFVSGMVGTTSLLGLTDITGYGTADLAYKMVKIADGKAVVPLYYLNTAATSYANSYIAYDGNDNLSTTSLLSVLIIDDEDGSLKTNEVSAAMTSAATSGRMKTITSGTFSGGSLTVTW